MAQLPIYTYSSSILREKAREVQRIDNEIVELIVNMFETMTKAQGIGLAANQVGMGHAVCVLDLSEVKDKNQTHPPIVLINPIITDTWGDIISLEEGCLSLPDLREEIERPERLHVRYRDADFQPQELEAEGMFARVLQHEVDHLNGILFIDYLRGLKKKMIFPMLNKIKKGEVETDYPLADAVSLVTP